MLAAARGLLEALAEAAARRPEEPKWADLADTLADGALAIARAALARELSSVDDDVPRGSGRHCTPSRATAPSCCTWPPPTPRC